MADEMLRMEEKMGIALEMTKETIQKRAPSPTQRVQVKALCTLTASGFMLRMIVMYYIYVSFLLPLHRRRDRTMNLMAVIPMIRPVPSTEGIRMP